MIIYFNDLKVEVPEDFFKGTDIEYVVQTTHDHGDIPRINVDDVSVTKNNVEMVLKYILSLEKGRPILRQSTNIPRDVEIANYIGFKKAAKILALAGIKQRIKGYERLFDHLDLETIRSMIHVSYGIHVETEIKNNKVHILGVYGSAIKVVIDILDTFSKTSDPEYYYNILYEIIDKCFFTTEDDMINIFSSVSQKLKFLFLECDISEFEHCDKSFSEPMTDLYRYCKEIDEQNDDLKDRMLESLISEGADTIKVYPLDGSKPFIIRKGEDVIKAEDFPVFYDHVEIEYENGAYKKLNSVGIPTLVRQ